MKINKTTSYYLLLFAILLSVASVLTLNPNFLASLAGLLFLKKPEGSKDIAEKNQFELSEADSILIDSSTVCDERSNPAVSVVDSEIYIGYECMQGSRKEIKAIKVDDEGQILCSEFGVSVGNGYYENPSVYARKNGTENLIFMSWQGQAVGEKETSIHYRVFNAQCEPRTESYRIESESGLTSPMVGNPFDFYFEEFNNASNEPLNPNILAGIVWGNRQAEIGRGAVRAMEILQSLKPGTVNLFDVGFLDVLTNQLIANMLFGSSSTSDDLSKLFYRMPKSVITFGANKKESCQLLGKKYDFSAFTYFAWTSKSSAVFRKINYDFKDFGNSALCDILSFNEGILPMTEENPCPRLKEENVKIVKMSDKTFAMLWADPYEKKAYVRLHNGTHLSKGYQIHDQDFKSDIKYDAERLGDDNNLVTVFSGKGKISGKNEIYLRFINDTMLATLKGYDPKCPPAPIDLSYLYWVIPVATVVSIAGARGIYKYCTIPEEPEFAEMDDKVTHVSQKGVRQAGSEIKEVKDEDHSHEGSGNLASIVPTGP